MHPECPDYDLCERCEAMPIPVHPETHPLLKMKSPDVVIPTVYRVGGTEIIPRPGCTDRSVNGYQPSYQPRPAYNPVYVNRPPLAVPVPIPVRSRGNQEEHVCDEERAATPRPASREKAVSIEEVQEHKDEHTDEQDPFADPKISPIATVASSIVSGFQNTVEDLMSRNDLSKSSPLSETAENEKSLFQGFLDRPPVLAKEKEKDNNPPSFAHDLEEWMKKARDTFAIKTTEFSPDMDMKEKEQQAEETLASLVSGVGRLVALVAGEPSSTAGNEQEASVKDNALVAEAQSETDAEIAPEVTPAVKETVPLTEAVAEPAKELEKDVPVPVLSAGFVADVSVPDGQLFPPGAEFMKCWRMVNDGKVDWPESTEIVFVAGQSGLVSEGSEVVKIGKVKAGEEIDVWTGELKAPEAAGKYVGYWRLRDGETMEVFGNSIWVEIQVAETDHHSDDNASMSGSSIVQMPTALSAGAGSIATSSRHPQSLTITIPSSNSTSMDDESEIGSEGSLIDYMSDGEVVAWEDARSGVDGSIRSPPPAPAPVPSSPLGDEFELVYDSSSDL